ncbi:hypothetical protein IQ06DRAFT_267583 [Phaeosphaeriaceae sp. SRC1lsM3a]|nr:hypothetical protein IQ06DRAFT_267583 [Stagonospora sp. SRC1lsM3a]
MSSLPLHLLFNSIVFTNLQANNYIVVPTMEDWLYGAAYNTSGFIDYNNNTARSIVAAFNKYKIDLNDTLSLDDGSVVPRYKNMSTTECFDQYSTQYTSNIGNVYLIQGGPAVMRQEPPWWLGVDNTTGNYSWRNRVEDLKEFTAVNADAKFPYLSKASDYPSNGWRCPSHRNATCNVNDEREVPSDRSKWEPYESPVRYCMIEQVQEICKLQFSFLIAIIVIFSNLVKTGVIGWVLCRYQSHHALVTLGDAIANFLEYPDRTTRGRCLQSHKQIEVHFNARTFIKAEASGENADGPEPVRCTSERKHWMHAPSYGRWFGTYMFYIVILFVGFLGITWTIRGMPKDSGQLWKVGFGTVNGNNLWGTTTTLMGGVLLANSPQVVLSYLYLAFNGLYTNMFIAKEWSTYLHERKPLRVTATLGQQRSTYWLTVPYRYAIPMTVVSGAFHWLASQSLFMVQITVTDSLTREISEKEQISTLGFSPFALILTCALATLIASSGLAMGRLKFPAGMPVAGSCSAAISAACHPPPEDADAHLLPVQWGVVSHGEETSGDAIGHCSFSSLPVQQPIPGQLYA